MKWSKGVRNAVAVMALGFVGQCLAAPTVLRVSAQIAPRVQLQVHKAPMELVITAEDVTRGYVEVAQAVQFDIRTNCPYRMEIRLTPGQVAKAHATVLDRSLQATEGANGTLDLPMDLRGSRGTVAYRFILAADAKAGSYAWPARLMVQPRAA